MVSRLSLTTHGVKAVTHNPWCQGCHSQPMVSRLSLTTAQQHGYPWCLGCHSQGPSSTARQCQPSLAVLVVKRHYSCGSSTTTSAPSGSLGAARSALAHSAPGCPRRAAQPALVHQAIISRGSSMGPVSMVCQVRGASAAREQRSHGDPIVQHRLYRHPFGWAALLKHRALAPHATSAARGLQRFHTHCMCPYVWLAKHRRTYTSRRSSTAGFA